MLTDFDSVPENFPVNEITVPILLQYATNDQLADIADVERLIPMLSGTKDLYLQQIDDFNHIDFVMSVNAFEIVYSKILWFFAKHTI